MQFWFSENLHLKIETPGFSEHGNYDIISITLTKADKVHRTVPTEITITYKNTFKT